MSYLTNSNLTILNNLRYFIPNALVYHSKYVFQIFWKKIKVLSFFKASQNDNLISKLYFLTCINFSDHTCCHGNNTKYEFDKDLWRKHSFYHNLKTRTDIITTFSRVWDMYPGCIPVKFCAIPPQIIRVIEIFLLLWIFVISEIINTKTLKIKN